MAIEFKNNPTESTRITSPYGYRISPITKRPSGHKGIDIGALTRGISGDRIYSVADGTVIISKVNNGGINVGYGYYVVVQHYGFATLYAHLTRLITTVGQKVQAGQVIGYMGATGQSTGVHLHFGLIEGNFSGQKWKDPAPYLMTATKVRALAMEYERKKLQAQALITQLKTHIQIDDTEGLLADLIEYYNGSCWWVIKKLLECDFTNATPITGKKDIYRRAISKVEIQDKTSFNNELLKIKQDSIFWVIKKLLDKLGVA